MIYCVMKDGEIMQVAEPLSTLYDQPTNLFVAKASSAARR